MPDYYFRFLLRMAMVRRFLSKVRVFIQDFSGFLSLLGMISSLMALFLVISFIISH
jgi:hypothetical protein